MNKEEIIKQMADISNSDSAEKVENLLHLLRQVTKIGHTYLESIAQLLGAAQLGHTESARLLIARGAEVDCADGDGKTALMYAAKNGHTETARLLIANGAAVDHTDNDGETALMWAAYYGHIETARLLIANGAKVDHVAHADKVRHVPNYGCTALMCATQCGHPEAVGLLIARGAEVDQVNNDGETALMLAARRGHTETAELLIARGAEVDKVDNNGWAALIHAAETGHTETARLLIAKGAEVDKASHSDSTALMWAALKGCTETVELLIAKGAKVDHAKVDHAGNNWTALTLAAQEDYLKTAEVLILGENKDFYEYYTHCHLAVEKFLSTNSPYLANIKRLISIRIPALRKQLCMIMNIAGLECTDSRFSDPLPELPLEIWQMNILKSYFTSLFVIEDGKFHARGIGGVPAESFVINEGIAPYIKLWAKLVYEKNGVGFKIVHQKLL